MNKFKLGNLVSLAKESAEFWKEKATNAKSFEYAGDLIEYLSEFDAEQRLGVFDDKQTGEFPVPHFFATKDDVSRYCDVDEVSDEEMMLMMAEMPESISLWWKEIIRSSYNAAMEKASND